MGGATLPFVGFDIVLLLLAVNAYMKHAKENPGFARRGRVSVLALIVEGNLLYFIAYVRVLITSWVPFITRFSALCLSTCSAALY